jgi:hypothetical protein
MTEKPSDCSCRVTLLQEDASSKAPCNSTIVGFVDAGEFGGGVGWALGAAALC